MDEHSAQILSLCFKEKAKIIIRQRKKSKQKWAEREKGDRNLFCKKVDILVASGLAIGKKYFPTARPHSIL
jgi:hypothetical protein